MVGDLYALLTSPTGWRPLRLTLFSSPQAGDLYAVLFSLSSQTGDSYVQPPPSSTSTQTKDFYATLFSLSTHGWRPLCPAIFFFFTGWRPLCPPIFSFYTAWRHLRPIPSFFYTDFYS
jgi:hypothetical protein